MARFAFTNLARARAAIGRKLLTYIMIGFLQFKSNNTTIQ